MYANMGDLAAGICEDPFLSNKTVRVIPFLMAIPHPYKADNMGSERETIEMQIW